MRDTRPDQGVSSREAWAAGGKEGSRGYKVIRASGSQGNRPPRKQGNKVTGLQGKQGSRATGK